MYTLDDFISVIHELVTFFGNMAETERIKLNATSSNDILLIEECMKKEQAEVLRFRGLDKKRNEIQDAIGFHNLPLKEILPQIDSQHSADCAVLFENLANVVKLYQSSASSAKTMMELNLHRINTALANSNVQAKDAQVYSPTGQPSSRPTNGHFTSRHV